MDSLNIQIIKSKINATVTGITGESVPINDTVHIYVTYQDSTHKNKYITIGMICYVMNNAPVHLLIGGGVCRQIRIRPFINAEDDDWKEGDKRLCSIGEKNYRIRTEESSWNDIEQILTASRTWNVRKATPKRDDPPTIEEYGVRQCMTIDPFTIDLEAVSRIPDINGLRIETGFRKVWEVHVMMARCLGTKENQEEEIQRRITDRQQAILSIKDAAAVLKEHLAEPSAEDDDISDLESTHMLQECEQDRPELFDKKL